MYRHRRRFNNLLYQCCRIAIFKNIDLSRVIDNLNTLTLNGMIFDMNVLSLCTLRVNYTKLNRIYKTNKFG